MDETVNKNMCSDLLSQFLHAFSMLHSVDIVRLDEVALSLNGEGDPEDIELCSRSHLN